jgi:hypothetical protein
LLVLKVRVPLGVEDLRCDRLITSLLVVIVQVEIVNVDGEVVLDVAEEIAVLLHTLSLSLGVERAFRSVTTSPTHGGECG